MSINPTPVIPRSTQGHLLRGAKRRGNPFPARHRRADGTSGTPSPTERFAALMRRAGCPHPATRQTKAPAINGGGLRAGRPTRNPAAVRPLMRAGRGSEFHPARGIPKRNTILSDGVSFWSGRRGSNSLPRPWQGRALPDELRPQTQDRLYLSSQRLSTPVFPIFAKNSCPPLRAGMPAFIA